MRLRGVIVNVLARQGTPAKQIVATARDIEADAIAIATHARRLLDRHLFGCVAEEVLGVANIPVLLVPARLIRGPVAASAVLT
jgi:nucleotide-binding universal stress UspA family protein